MHIFVQCRLFIYSFVLAHLSISATRWIENKVSICGNLRGVEKNERTWVSSIERTRCRNEVAVTAAALLKNPPAKCVLDAADLLSKSVCVRALHMSRKRRLFCAGSMPGWQVENLAKSPEMAIIVYEQGSLRKQTKWNANKKINNPSEIHDQGWCGH